MHFLRAPARLAQSVERQALNLMVVGSSPTVGDKLFATSASTTVRFSRWCFHTMRQRGVVVITSA